MDSLYDDVETSEQFPRRRRQSSSDLSASSAEQAGQVPPSAHHHHHHHHHQFHGPLRYNQQPRPYPSRRLEQSSASRQSRDRHHGSSSSSESASSRSSHSSHSANTHPHNGDDEAEDDDGYFLSAVSGLPSIEVEDLRHTRGSSEEAAVSVEAPTSQLDEDYAVPTWSQGSRLLERRIQQAVDQETMELEEETPWSRRAGQTANASLTAEFLAGGRLQPGPPPLAPLSAAPTSLLNETASAAVAAAAPALNAGPLRMQEAKLQADPRNRLLDLVITNTSASVTLGEIEQTMQWSTRYEPMYGALLEYLQSYQSIFVVSPVDDRVRLRRHFSIRTAAALRERGVASQQPASSSSPTQQQQRSSRSRLRSRRGVRETAVLRSPSAVDRRSGKPSLPSAEALAAHIGSVSYSCVAEHLNLDTLEVVYRRRGYETAMMHAVLHVTSENDFHLFLFASGAVVWWGMDRKDHWMVEDDFLSPTTHIAEGVAYRYVQSEIEALFPIWCSYEVDEQCVDMAIHSPLGIRPAAVKPSLEQLSKVLCFDHYLVPSSEPARSLVMLTFSHSLGRSARVDYFEYVTKWSHRHILSIPAEFSGLLDYFSTKRRIAKLEGEIEVAQLAIQSIHDTPEVLWEVPWLQAYYDLAEQQNTAQSRLSWFTSRSDTLLEQLSHIKARRHRLFMLGSDVFLIVILILDVMFMTSRLVAKMYFKVEED